MITKKKVLECLDLCVYSYENPTRDWQVDLSGYTNLHWYKKENASAFIVHKKDNLYLTFTGSNDLKDWKMDFNFGLVNWQNFRIPNGFLDYWLLLRDDILYYIANNYFKNLIITGHSLGASASIIASLDIVKNILSKNEKIENISFGSPHTFGNLKTKRFYKNNIKGAHIINSCDIVTRVPLFMLNNYKRFKVGKCNFIIRFTGSIKAHYPAEYRKNIITNKKINKKLRQI